MPFSDWSPQGHPDYENRAEPLSRGELARVDRLARKAENLTADGQTVDVTDSGVHLGPAREDGFWARITFQIGTSLSAQYTFTELQYNLATDDWITKEGGLTTTGQSENEPIAVEVNGNANVKAHPEHGALVFLRKLAHLRYGFSHCCVETPYIPPDPGSGSGSGSGMSGGSCSPPCAVTPHSVTLSAAGFLDGSGTGYCTNFNGDWTLTQTGPCAYAYADGVRSFHADILPDGTWDVHLWTSDGPCEVRYLGSPGAHCCAAQVLGYDSTPLGGCGDHPATITLTPHCDDDTSSGSGTGSGGTGLVVTACCPDGVPARLYVTFGGSLAAVGTVQVDYPEPSLGGGVWAHHPLASSTICGIGSLNVYVRCDAGGWVVNADKAGGAASIAVTTTGTTTVSCNPLLANLTLAITGSACPGTATAVISELPP